MAIPNNQLFEEFIAKARVIERPSGPAVLFSAGVGRPPLYLEYPDIELTLPAVLRVVSRELAQQGCAASPKIAIAVLGIVAATRADSVAAVEHANRCLSQVHTSELHQYLVLPTPCRRGYEAVFGEFRVRPFDPERLLYWSRRGGSSYPLDLSQLAGKAALERERFSTRVLNCDTLLAEDWAATNQNDDLPAAVQDAYYSAVFEHHIEQIPGLLRRNLLVLEAGALVHFDIESLFGAVFGQRIGLFQWLSATGRQRTWAVLSSVSGLNINLVPPDLLTECRLWLREVIGFSNLDLARPLDRTIDTFCTLLQRAHQHRMGGRGDEAALHFVIALDFVLGTEGRSAESVAERAAVVAHRPLGRSVQDQVRRVKQLYDARSKYVHEGRPIPVEEIKEAEQVAMEVLWALLTVSAKETLSNTSEWLRKINYVAAALKDGRPIPEAEFAVLGMAAEGVHRVPPNRVREDSYETVRDVGEARH